MSLKFNVAILLKFIGIPKLLYIVFTRYLSYTSLCIILSSYSALTMLRLSYDTVITHSIPYWATIRNVNIFLSAKKGAKK